MTNNHQIFVNGDGELFGYNKLIHIDDRPLNVMPDECIHTNVIAAPPFYKYLDITKNCLQLIKTQ